MDGDIKSIGDLKIVIDASTEQFSGNIASARAAIAQFGTEGQGSLSKFDAALLKTGEAVENMRGKIDRLAAAMPGVIGAITRGMELLQKLASVTGKTEEFDDLRSSIVDLGGAVNDTFLTHFGAAGRELDLAKKDAVDYEEKIKDIGAQYGILLPTMGALSKAFQGLASDMRMAGGIDKMSADDLDKAIISKMSALRDQQRIIEDIKGNFRTGPVNEFIGDVTSVEEAQKVFERLNDELKTLKDRRDELSTGLDFFDATDTIDKLQKQNAELELQNETLGMAKSAALEYLAVKRALAAADKDGKPFSIADHGQLLEEARLLRDNTQAREDYEAGKRDAERQRKERERQEKAIDDIDAKFEADLAQIQAKTLALTQSARAAEEMAYFEKEMASARKKNIELTEADVEGIRAQAKAIADANEVYRTRQREIQRLQEDANVFNQSILSEFTRWTQGAEVSWKRMVSNILAESARLALLRNVLGPLLGGNGTNVNDSVFGSLFGGFRANGGPVEAGRSYLVGENGPEVVTMGANAHVTPAAGAQTFAPVITIDARGSTPDAVAQLESRLPALIIDHLHQARERGMA